ncbi:TPA: DUF2931 family protein [Photobacterium damselae]
MKKINSLTLIALSLMSTACTSSPSLRSGDTNWAVRVSQSYAYPVRAGAFGIYFDENRPQFMMGGVTRNTRKKIEDSSFGPLVAIGNPSQQYDWIGTPLVDYINQTVLSPTTLNPYIPDAVVLNWYWDYNFHQYFTYFVLPEKAKKLMSIPQKIIVRGITRDCYQNEMTFAMLPNGDANVWITGCNKLTYVGMVSPGLPPDNIMNIIDNVAGYYKKDAMLEKVRLLPDVKAVTVKRSLARLKEVGLTPNDPPPVDKIGTYYMQTSCEGKTKAIFTEPLDKLDLNKVPSVVINSSDYVESLRRCKQLGYQK